LFIFFCNDRSFKELSLPVTPLVVTANKQAIDRVSVITELDDGTTYAIYSMTVRAISFQGHLEQ